MRRSRKLPTESPRQNFAPIEKQVIGTEAEPATAPVNGRLVFSESEMLFVSEDGCVSTADPNWLGARKA